MIDETGAAVGTTLSIPAAMNAYVLPDRASRPNFANRAGPGIVFQDGRVQDGHGPFSQYGYLSVHPARRTPRRSDPMGP